MLDISSFSLQSSTINLKIESGDNIMSQTLSEIL